MPIATQRSIHMCWFGVSCFLMNGRITSWLMVIVALKIRLSSVEIMARIISRQKSPSIPAGSMFRRAAGSSC